MNDFQNLPLTQDVVFALAGILFSAFLRYTPRIDVWFEALDAKYKSLIVLLFTLVTPWLILLGVCVQLWTSTVQCNNAGVGDVVRLMLVLLAASQVGHNIFPKRESVVAAAKNERFARMYASARLDKIVLGVSPQEVKDDSASSA